MQDRAIWTVGHSTHSLAKFIGILKSADIECIADVRSFPGSRKFPHFNSEALEISLHEQNIEYIHFRELGGRRKVKPDSLNINWRHPAFRGYADYMETDSFRNAIHELEKLASARRIALMCSEALWWRCHRSMISDWLKLYGWTVLHITGDGKTHEHTYTSASRVQNGELFYSPG